jgi:hypothetical protein
MLSDSISAGPQSMPAELVGEGAEALQIFRWGEVEKPQST